MNILYLQEMGKDDDRIPTDIKNHRVRVIENVDIEYQGERYNMFFEFTDYDYIDKSHRACIDTEYTDENGDSWGCLKLENDLYESKPKYTKKDILKTINKYKIGEPYTDVCLIDTTVREIIRTKGGYREKEILGEHKDFYTEGDSYFEQTGTWNADRKVVAVCKREWEQIGDGRRLTVTDQCEVDLVHRTIVG